MAYIKTIWSTGDTITATLMNHVESQYSEAKTELEKIDGTSDIKPDWSNVKNSAHASTHASAGSDPITPADIGAVNKAGDTMTGMLTLDAIDGNNVLKAGGFIALGLWLNRLFVGSTATPVTIASSDNPKVRVVSTDYTLWHAGNDGAGSGLDADTVDGKHASDFSAIVTPGNVIILESLVEKSGSTTTSFHTHKRFYVGRGGKYRVTGDLRTQSSADTAYVRAAAPVDNGSADGLEIPVTSNFSTTSSTYVSFTLDMNLPVGQGGTILIQAYSTASNYVAYLQNIRIKAMDNADTEGYVLNA